MGLAVGIRHCGPATRAGSASPARFRRIGGNCLQIGISHCTILIRSNPHQSFAKRTITSRFHGNHFNFPLNQYFDDRIAKSATNAVYFAIAQFLCVMHTETAFQASSPKTSRPGRQLPGLFLPAIARKAPSRPPDGATAHPAL
ncbi:MAG: hypothetical protein ACK40C_09960 [Novosphingobium meiothermophilum]